jgi:hypothetical protein
MSDFTRITQNPAVMGGKPCIRGLRVTVGMLVGQIGGGRTVDELLADYPYLEREDEARHNAEPGLRRGDACVALLPVAQMWIEKGEACLAPTQASTKPASAHWIDGR